MTEVMKTFSSVILVQFCASSTVITVSIYLLSMKNPENLEFLMVLSYLLSMMTEFFLYCWFGNEVTLKVIIQKFFYFILSTTEMAVSKK